jgi:uncharacterized protein (TIGR01244 family)
MMELRRIADGVSVTGQIDAGDVKRIAELGFRTLISNRPDTEPGAVPHEKIRAAAEAAGLVFHHIPVVSGAFTQQDVEAMAAALRGAERPVLAYCRSGARSAALFNLATASTGG